MTVGRYFYDGEGKRVKKVTDTETTVFVYSSGKLIAEYSTQISQSPTTAYTTTDHLGSPRIITDGSGQVKSRRDFMPFGEDIFVNIGARTPALQYSSTTDDTQQKYIGSRTFRLSYRSGIADLYHLSKALAAAGVSIPFLLFEYLDVVASFVCSGIRNELLAH